MCTWCDVQSNAKAMLIKYTHHSDDTWLVLFVYPFCCKVPVTVLNWCFSIDTSLSLAQAEQIESAWGWIDFWLGADSERGTVGLQTEAWLESVKTGAFCEVACPATWSAPTVTLRKLATANRLLPSAWHIWPFSGRLWRSNGLRSPLLVSGEKRTSKRCKFHFPTFD